MGIATLGVQPQHGRGSKLVCSPNYPEPCFPSPRGLSRRYGFHHQSRFFGNFRLNIQVFNLARNIFPGGFIAGSACSGSPVPALLFPICPGVREQRRLPSLCIAAIADRLTYPPPPPPRATLPAATAISIVRLATKSKNPSPPTLLSSSHTTTAHTKTTGAPGVIQRWPFAVITRWAPD